jgi:hypothetical protein
LITGIIYGADFRSQRCSLCNLLHSLVTSSLLGPTIYPSTPFSNTLCLCSSFIVRGKFHTHIKQQAKS